MALFIGSFYIELDQLSEARPPLEEALQLYTKLVAKNPADAVSQNGLQEARNNLENLKRLQDLATGQKRAIAPDDRTYLNPNDPNTPLRRSVVRLWPTFIEKTSSGPEKISSAKTSGIGPLLGTGFVVRRDGDRAWIATARHVVLSPNTNAPPTQLEAELYSGTLPANLLSARLSVVLPTAAQSDANSGDDLILLEVRGLPADITPLPLAGEPPRGSLKVVGHPTESPEPWVVVAVKVVADLFDPAAKLFRLSGALNEGASGAPVIDSSGRVVGLVRTRTQIDDTTFVVSAYRSGAIREKMAQSVPAAHGSRSTP